MPRNTRKQADITIPRPIVTDPSTTPNRHHTFLSQQ